MDDAAIEGEIHGRGLRAVAARWPRPRGSPGPPAALRRLEPAQGQVPAWRACAGDGGPGGRRGDRDSSGPRPAPPVDELPAGWRAESRGLLGGAAGRAAPQPGFVPNDEVDRLEWLPVPAARARLSYSRDTFVLDDFASGPADTVPCILVRHAAAGTKEAWRAAGHTDDLPRPLDAPGLQEAELLGRLLSCYASGRVISSPAQRCVDTVRPYAALTGLAIEIEPAFGARLTADAPPDRLAPATAADRGTGRLPGARGHLRPPGEPAAVPGLGMCPARRARPRTARRCIRAASGSCTPAAARWSPRSSTILGRIRALS